ncbi:MAG: cyclopropane fatty acyl phospholipid synthase, partial [Pseudomonadota bacterium]
MATYCKRRSFNMSRIKEILNQLLKKADIEINGPRPWDIQITNEQLYSAVMRKQSLGLGEAYIAKWWEVQKLDEFFIRLLNAKLDDLFHAEILKNPSLLVYGIRPLARYIKASLFNYQTQRRAFQIGEKHYDVGNDLFSVMLDKEMNYTCGYWREATTLDEAQAAKCDLICKKLYLEPGQTILDIGCGWGSFARHAARYYGVSVVGVTVSKEQKALAEELCKGLPIEIRLQDYRDVKEKFDNIVSIGMFEHVGYKNYRTYMQVAKRCLNKGGKFLLHTMGANFTSPTGDEWIQRYIFPNSTLPSIKQMGQSIENLFIMEDWHNFGPDYAKTLYAWHANFEKNWDKLKG